MIIDRPLVTPVSSPPTLVFIHTKIHSSVTALVEVRLAVHEGSIWWNKGELLDAKTAQVQMAAGNTYDVSFSHESMYTGQERRDIEISVWRNGQKIADSEWDDAFSVAAPVNPAVTVTPPIAIDTEIYPPNPTILKTNILANVSGEYLVRLKVRASNTLMESQELKAYLPANTSMVVQFMHTPVYNSTESRNIEIEVLLGGQSLFKKNYSNVFTVLKPTSAMFVGRIKSVTGYIGALDVGVEIENKGFALNGWHSRVTLFVNGNQTDFDDQAHTRAKQDYVVRLATGDISNGDKGKIVLEGQDNYEWREVAVHEITFNVPGSNDEDGEDEDGGEKSGMSVPLLLGGAALLVYGLTKK